MKKGIFTTYLLLVLVSLGMISCKKEVVSENDKTEQTDLTNSDTGAYFASIEDYDRELQKVLSMNLRELLEWQKQQSYTSFGVECERFYSKINPEVFKSQEEIFTFVEENQKYIHFATDDNGDMAVESQLASHPNRFFISKDKIFTIQNMAYKCYNEGMISTSIENIEKLKLITDMKTLPSTKSESDFYVQYFSPKLLTKVNYRSYIEAKEQNNGRDQTRFWMQIFNTVMGSTYPSISHVEYTVQPRMKTMGIYFGCFRTLNAEIDIKYYLGYRSHDNKTYDYKYVYAKHTYNSSEPENKKTIVIGKSTYNGKDPQVGFVYSNSGAGTPSTPRCFITVGNIGDGI